jgi:hypothetical protein
VSSACEPDLNGLKDGMTRRVEQYLFATFFRIYTDYSRRSTHSSNFEIGSKSCEGNYLEPASTDGSARLFSTASEQIVNRVYSSSTVLCRPVVATFFNLPHYYVVLLKSLSHSTSLLSTFPNPASHYRVALKADFTSTG